MKILLFSQPRTRSSYLLDVLSKQYDIKNYFEKYIQDNNPENFYKKYYGKDKNFIFQKYQEKLRKSTDELFLTEVNYAMKVFPYTVMNWGTFNYFDDEEKGTKVSYKTNDIVNLEQSLRLRDYDQIYIIYRNNLTDLISSYFYALQINKFLIEKDESYKIEFFRPLGKIQTGNKFYGMTKTFVDSFLFLKNLHLFLDKRSIPYIKVEYNEIPQYIKNNFPNIESSFIDTEFDYKNTLTNYNEIDKKVMEIYNQSNSRTDWRKLFLSL